MARFAEPGDSLLTDVVGLLDSKNSSLANLAEFRHQDEMLGSLLAAAA